MARSTRPFSGFKIPLPGNFFCTVEQNAFFYFMLIVVTEGLLKAFGLTTILGVGFAAAVVYEGVKAHLNRSH